MGHYDQEIEENAGEIRRLHLRIHETYAERDKSKHKYREWENACKEFHESYNRLAFPGGFNGAYQRLLEGDETTMEAAISFLECRPYFFRSGYMFKDLLRKAKRAPLSQSQKERLNVIIDAYARYRAARKA
jgi:hypothetical protein